MEMVFSFLFFCDLFALLFDSLQSFPLLRGTAFLRTLGKRARNISDDLGSFGIYVHTIQIPSVKRAMLVHHYFD